jgi:sugar (pentulose or hexulose) kinase
VRGLLNGIVLESRRCLMVLEDLGLSCEAIDVAGGSASSSAFLTGLADATGRPVRFADDDDVDFSAIGAAHLVQVALSGTRDHDAAKAERARRRSVVEPNPENTATWEALGRRYDVALSALRPVFARRW